MLGGLLGQWPMTPLAQARANFVFLWVISGLWLPLVLAAWSNLAPPGRGATTQDYVIHSLSMVSLIVMALSQWPLLRRFVRSAWLWAAAGLIAFLIEQIVYFALIDLSMKLGEHIGDMVYYLSPLLSAGVAVAVAQAIVLRYWGLNGKSWFLICIATFIGALLLELLSIALVLHVMPEAQGQRAVVSNGLGTIVLWSVFGGQTGWLLWNRLHRARTNAVVPA